MSELINLMRYYHFMSGVLSHQQTDQLCSNCRAFANTAVRIKEGILELESRNEEELSTLAAGSLSMLAEARQQMSRINIPGDAVGQKKAGNCRMPEGVCFIKVPKMILDKI